MKAVICLSGGIASGKTTVAHALAEHFPSVAVRSFGDVVRNQARSQGKVLDRATLQAVGLSLVQADGDRLLTYFLKMYLSRSTYSSSKVFDTSRQLKSLGAAT